MSILSELIDSDINASILKTDPVANDPIQLLSKKLFGLPEDSVFIQIPCTEDPRCYVDLYGNDLDKEYELTWKQNTIRYATLVCFYSHITFRTSPNLECVITPEEEGLHIRIFDAITDNLKEDSLVTSREAFLSFIFHHSGGRRK